MNVRPEILEKISLEGKTAVVSGAASGIGLAVAHKLAGAGAGVALLDTDRKGGERARKDIEAAGARAEFYPCDVSRAAECRSTVARVVRDFRGLDVLVNCAGIIRRKTVVDMEEEEWDRVLEVNLKSVYLLCREAIPVMARRGGGSIVNIGSGWGLKGGEKAAAYCAAKAGVVNLTRAMAIDHGNRNIRVNCVCPGDVDTPLLRGEAAELGREVREFLREAADRPLHRVGAPEDVADAVLYLAGGMAGWVTGAVLVVDGGGIA